MHENVQLDTVIICDESYYIRLINAYSITIVIKYSLNILMIVQYSILIFERKFSDVDLVGTYKYIHSKNVCNEKKLSEVDEGTAAYNDILSKIKNEDLFDDIPCVVDYINRMAEKKHNLVMPTEGEVQMNLPLENADCKVQMNLANTVCIGHNELCKVIPPNNSDIADNESHDNSNHGIFCVTGNDLGFIDINSILDEDKMVI